MTRIITLIIFLVAAGAVFYMSATVTPETVRLNPDSTVDIIQTLFLLIFIALVLERALEVLISAWRAPGRENLESLIRRETEQDKKHELEEQRDKYKQDTRAISLAVGLVMGFLVSAVGIRVIEPLVQPESIDALADLQRIAFRIVDILLTGGVISGGSEGIHRIAKVFNAFMDKAEYNASSRGNTSGSN